MCVEMDKGWSEGVEGVRVRNGKSDFMLLSKNLLIYYKNLTFTSLEKLANYLQFLRAAA